MARTQDRALAVSWIGSVTALDNGEGLTPPMGYSSWNDCASNVTEARIKQTALALIKTGLAAKARHDSQMRLLSAFDSALIPVCFALP